MDNRGNFNETSLPEKEDFYSHLNMKDIADTDYKHAIRVYKDTLILADVFNNFQNICLEKYELDPARCFSAPRLAWQAARSFN